MFARFWRGRSTPAIRAILLLYPCRCLCLELVQITRTTPLRWMILHLSQIFFTDARTFIDQLSVPAPQQTCGGRGPIYNGTQFVRDSDRRAKAPQRLYRRAKCV